MIWRQDIVNGMMAAAWSVRSAVLVRPWRPAILANIVRRRCRRGAGVRLTPVSAEWLREHEAASCKRDPNDGD